MSHLHDSGFATLDFVAWQRELGVTAYHLATVERDYTLPDVHGALDEHITSDTLRQRVSEHVNLPDVDQLEAPPSRDGATQVYVIGTIDVGLPEGDILSSNFDEDERRYAFIGKKTDSSMDIAPVESISPT